MKKRFRVGATVFVFLGMVEVLNKCLALLNEPSDLKVYLGMAGILAMISVCPWILAEIWGHKHHKEEKHEASANVAVGAGADSK